MSRDWFEQLKEERQENIRQAKATLFAYLAEKHPHITRISASYSGSCDEGCVDTIIWFDATEVAIVDLKDEKLNDLVNAVFEHVTPPGFQNNEGGDGEFHIYPGDQKVVVEHTQNILTQKHKTYEA